MTTMRMVKAILVLISLFTSFCMQTVVAVEETKVPTIGTLKWAIYDKATSTLISSGEKTLHPDDISIKAIDSTLYNKKIELGEHFSFSLCDGIDSGGPAGKGFGLSGGRDDQRAFGWDWFTVDREGHATKLQESGELSFDTKATSLGAEISRMEFLTDVSIRLSLMKDGSDPLNPEWRINILKGSVISWPSAGHSNSADIASAPK